VHVPTNAAAARVRDAAERVVTSSADAVPPPSPERLADPSVPWPGSWDATGALTADLVHPVGLAIDAAWAARARLAATRVARPDLVVASQPLEPVVDAGAAVARRHGVPFVADHRHVLGVGRTHWRTRPERWWFRRLDGHATARSVLAIDIACTATEHVTELLPTVPRAFVPSGWDERDRVDVQVDRDRFVVAHAGWLYPFIDPRPWLRGIAGLLQRRPAARDVLRVDMIGGPSRLAGIDLRELAVAHGLPERAWCRTERLPKDEAMRRAGHAAVLLAQEFPDGLQAPSKLYDYAVLRGDLLLLGRPDGAMARDAALLGVRTAQHHDEATDVLVAAFDRWEAGLAFTHNDPDGRLAAARSVTDLDILLRAAATGDTARTRAAAATAGAVRPPVTASLAAAAERAAS
jgi:hypothetical protein